MIGRQSDFVGQSQPTNSVGQTYFSQSQSSNFVGQIQPTTSYVHPSPVIQQTTFVEQSVVPSTNFVGQNIQHSSFVDQNIQHSNFVGQNIQHSNFVDQNVTPLTKHSSSVGQNVSPNFQHNPLLTHPTTVGGQNSQQAVDQKHQHFNQNVIPKQIDIVAKPVDQYFRESRHIFFDNSTFLGDEDDEEEIDSPSDRIFRGWELDPHEFPWMVKLMVSCFYKHIPTDNIFQNTEIYQILLVFLMLLHLKYVYCG